MNRRTFIAQAACAAVVRKLPAAPAITAGVSGMVWNEVPAIPREVWEELARHQRMMNAITGAHLDTIRMQMK